MEKLKVHMKESEILYTNSTHKLWRWKEMKLLKTNGKKF